MRRVENSVIPLAVASPETWTPSRRLKSAAVAERDRVERKLAELGCRHAELAEALQDVADARDELREQLAILSRLAEGAGRQELVHRTEERISADARAARPLAGATSSDAHADQRDTVLRGQAIREAAVRTLATSSRAHEAVHYKEWYMLLRARGFVPAGKDPLATFLTQLGRSPLVTRSSEQGIYLLDHDFLTRARRQLERLRHELRDAHDAAVGSGAAELAAGRERRVSLTAEVGRVERDLEEALRSMAPDVNELRAAS